MKVLGVEQKMAANLEIHFSHCVKFLPSGKTFSAIVYVFIGFWILKQNEHVMSSNFKLIRVRAFANRNECELVKNRIPLGN